MSDENMYSFDYSFYISFYPDLKDMDYLTAYRHYMNHGISENRICCEKNLNSIIYENLLQIQMQKIKYQNAVVKHINEKRLNILIRTSMRPEFFKICIESVLSQKYSNYHIFICFDKIESESYLDGYKERDNMTIFYIQNESTEKYKFNLYNNELMNMVKDGFILFLDDDDMFTHEYCLRIINEHLKSDKNILIWKFMRPDKLIYPTTESDEIHLGEIDTTSVCFHNKFKHLVKWKDTQCGDFHFYSELFRKLKNPTQIAQFKKLDFILTKTIFHNKICSSVY